MSSWWSSVGQDKVRVYNYTGGHLVKKAVQMAYLYSLYISKLIRGNSIDLLQSRHSHAAYWYSLLNAKAYHRAPSVSSCQIHPELFFLCMCVGVRIVLKLCTTAVFQVAALFGVHSQCTQKFQRTVVNGGPKKIQGRICDTSQFIELRTYVLNTYWWGFQCTLCYPMYH